jgi:uncharacterized Tic20 family protein
MYMYTTEQKLLIAFSHLGGFTGFVVVAPLVIYLLSKDQAVKNNAKEAAAFQALITIGGIAVGIISFIGRLLTPVLIGVPISIVGGLIGTVLAIAGIVLPIVATVKVLKGEEFSYPITGAFVRGIQ